MSIESPLKRKKSCQCWLWVCVQRKAWLQPSTTTTNFWNLVGLLCGNDRLSSPVKYECNSLMFPLSCFIVPDFISRNNNSESAFNASKHRTTFPLPFLHLIFTVTYTIVLQLHVTRKQTTIELSLDSTTVYWESWRILTLHLPVSSWKGLNTDHAGSQSRICLNLSLQCHIWVKSCFSHFSASSKKRSH